MDQDYESRRALAAAARRVNHAIRVSGVEPDELADVARELDLLADRLAAVEVPGPHCQVVLGELTMTEMPGVEVVQPEEVFPYSPVIGPLNPLSPPAELTVRADKTVVGTVVLGTAYNGPPWDLVHGGVIAEVFDELLGVTAMVAAGGGFTGRLTVHYRKPTPINEELRLEGWVDEVSGRKIVARGRLYHGDVLTAEAEGLFIQSVGPLQA